ncbi:MAG: hypothetical protein LBR56_08065 [Sporomusaceae bacterium]|jgi:hypothetical protein|nr:hypothetical protein [Sporomusaceae bacterium]
METGAKLKPLTKILMGAVAVIAMPKEAAGIVPTASLGMLKIILGGRRQ